MIQEVLTWLEKLAEILPPLGIIVGGIIAVSLLVNLSRRALNIRSLLKREIVTLELTPPSTATKTPLATQQLLTVLHGLQDSRSVKEKLLRRTINFSLEIVANKKQGIRYIVKATKEEIEGMERNIASYLPSMRFKRIDDDQSIGNGSILTLKQTGHFAYPLASIESLDSHDPLSYLTGAMTKLSDDDQITLQFAISPVYVSEAAKLSKHLLNNEELLLQLGKRKSKGIGIVFDVIGSILFAILDAIGEMISPQEGRLNRSIIISNKWRRSLSLLVRSVCSNKSWQIQSTIN